ncbi:MAG: hypothetical protein KDA84_07750 [Planctomycetaceae bacterium]|nr:hypothetical protein [Planctomycetaceae bacterium]
MEVEWSYDSKTRRIINKGNGLPIADCKLSGPSNPHPQDWNGWLLAAAPDLLRSLDNVLRLLECHAPDIYERNDSVARADDAVKKATGEA